MRLTHTSRRSFLSLAAGAAACAVVGARVLSRGGLSGPNVSRTSRIWNARHHTTYTTTPDIGESSDAAFTRHRADVPNSSGCTSRPRGRHEPSPAQLSRASRNV